ncbi:MAG TPA: carbohydrate kinase family protein [bacterium]|nr:carbohydrate kinase family protein [bacterium]
MAGKRTRSPEVVVAGSVYCDLIFFNLDGPPALGEEVRTDHFTLTPGGGGFITAAGLARLGVRTALRTYVGRDLLGNFQLDAIRRAGIDTAQVRRHPRLGTAVSVVYSTGGDRGFLSYKGCAWETGALLTSWLPVSFRGLRHVHFAGMRPPFEPQLRLLDGLREAGVITSLDIGWNPPVFGVPAFKDVIRRVHIFMPSWRDAQWLTGTPTPDEALRALADLVELPVIKLGAEGAVALNGSRTVRVPPPRVQAVDTTGAGDAFNAGFIWARLRGEPVERCLAAGNVCGALSTRAAGGTTAFPTLRELRSLLKRAAS